MVSVIMPAHNGARHIAESVRSVLKQTYDDFELIVIDDGSTDETARVVRGFQSADARVQYFYQENRGQAAARNAGIGRARGELVAFLDQDDLWESEKLALQVEAMSRTGADIVFSDGFIFAEDDAGSEAVSFSTVTGGFDGPRMFSYLFLRHSIPVLSVLVRKEALDKVGPLEESQRFQNSDDYDLWLRLAAYGATFFGMREKLVRYRMHARQASSDRVRMLRSEIAVLEKNAPAAMVDARAADARFRSLYRELVVALLDEGRLEEARESLKQLRLRDRFRASTLAQSLLLRVLPRQYNNVHLYLNRARASLSHRVGRPVQSAWRTIASRAL